MLTHMTPRDDAVLIGTSGLDRRLFVPTTWETKWVRNWDEFRAADGKALWNEDQTEIVLSLPPGHKFSCSFNREDSING